MQHDSRKPYHSIGMHATEINLLIYNYLRDSGFDHAAWAVAQETRLGTQMLQSYVKQGALIELLAKALLYIDVEHHWHDGEVGRACNAPFSLLKKHVCSSSSSGAPHSQSAGTSVNSPGVSRTANGAVAGDGPTATAPPSSRRTAGTGATMEALVSTAKRRAGALPTIDQQPAKRLRTDQHEPSDAVTSENSRRGAVSRGQLQPASRPLPDQATLIATGKYPYALLEGHSSEIYSSSWNPNPSSAAWLVTGAGDGTVRLWDTHDHDAESALSLKTERVLQAASASRRPENGSGAAMAPEQVDVLCVDWNALGTAFAAGTSQGTLRLWSFNESGARLRTAQRNPSAGAIFSVKFSPSGEFLLAATLDGDATLWHVPTKEYLQVYRSNFRNKDIQPSCLDIEWLDDSTFVTCSADSCINAYNRRNVIPFRNYSGHAKDVNAIAFSHDRLYLASCSDDHTARIWPAQDLKKLSDGWTSYHNADQVQVMDKPLQTLVGHNDVVTAMSWIPRAGRACLATASSDHTARVWDVTTGECIFIVQGHNDRCYAVNFSPDGSFLATGGGDSTILITSIRTGATMFQWRFNDGRMYPEDGKNESVYDVNWRRSEDGSMSLAVSVGEKLALFDMEKVGLIGY